MYDSLYNKFKGLNSILIDVEEEKQKLASEFDRSKQIINCLQIESQKYEFESKSNQELEEMIGKLSSENKSLISYKNKLHRPLRY